ncbi:MAG TPA: hypothetical protein VHQ00_14135 [Chloroflexota bacterium]|nr:hypothetical protein [Chloroflexota bacterium]
MPGLPAYAVPRSVNEPDRLLPFFTTRQALSTGLGVFLAVVVWSARAAALFAGEWGEALYWTLLLLPPLFGFLATRRVSWPARARGRWEVWQLALAWARYCLRPRRTVWKGGHR